MDAQEKQFRWQERAGPVAVQSPVWKGCNSSGLWDLSEEMEARFFATLCA